MMLLVTLLPVTMLLVVDGAGARVQRLPLVSL